MKRKLLIITILIICGIAISLNQVYATEPLEDPSDDSTTPSETVLDSGPDTEAGTDVGDVEDDDLESGELGGLSIDSGSEDTKKVDIVSDEKDILPDDDTTPSPKTVTLTDEDSDDLTDVLDKGLGEDLDGDESKDEDEDAPVLLKSATTTMLRSAPGGISIMSAPSDSEPEVETEPTPTIGARSATNSSGDVFLGGNYLEVGISKGGSFGTSAEAPADFQSHASSSNGYSLGLLMDGDGWGVGKAPTTGDFFLPGTPEERFGVAYEIDGTTYQYFKCDRYDDDEYGYPSSPGFVVYTTDDSNIESGLLKATVHGTTPHNVVVENTYSFGVDDKFYRTEVKITNNSGKEINKVRFFRSFDPDQDVDIYDNYYTYNKVICNPDSSQPGGSDNFALVVARGATSLEGFFLVSFDNRARASRGVSFAPKSLYLDGLWVESTPGLPTYSTDEAIEMTTSNKNGYTCEDSAIAMTFNIGTLAAGEATEFSHFSSLDPDVISSLNKIKEVVNAVLESATDESLTITVEDGYEYSIDGGKTWQTGGTFEGLDPETEYTILQRPVDGTDDDIVELVASTKKEGPVTPDISVRIITENSITVAGEDNYEYSIDDGQTWQESPEFTGLTSNTDYKIVARIKETTDTAAGKPSTVLAVTTVEATEIDVDALAGIDVTVDLSGSIPNVAVCKGAVYSAVSDDEDLATAVENEQEVEIKFIVKDSSLSAEELALINEKLGNNQAIALTVDVSIALYIDGEFVKNITELSSPITFTLGLPKNIQESKNLGIFRTHKDVSTNKYTVTKIDDEDEITATLTTTTSEFSHYVFAAEKKETAVGGGGGSSDNAGTTIISSVGFSPRTGDNINLCIALLLIATSNLIFLSVIERKRVFEF